VSDVRGLELLSLLGLSHSFEESEVPSVRNECKPRERLLPKISTVRALLAGGGPLLSQDATREQEENLYGDRKRGSRGRR